MNERARRIATNEALFRDVNERIQDMSAGFAAPDATIEIVCECGAADCVEQISIAPRDYERARADARLFVLVRGHEDATVERVVERKATWIVVEKTAEPAADIAEDTDPRT